MARLTVSRVERQRIEFESHDCRDSDRVDEPK